MGARRRVLRSLAVPAWVLLVATCPVLGQTTGSITGRILDQTGSPLPGATIEAKSPALQGPRATTSSADGFYRLPSVPPGTYRVRAALPGFRPVETTATVLLDATATVDMAIQLSAEEQVVVSGKTPVIDKTSTTTGTNYEARVIDRLPVGRNYADVVFLQPGVQADFGETQERSLAISIYGSTSAENLWLIDGVNTTNVIKGVQGKDINSEFVQEVEVKTGGYQAEYGRNTGGVVNVITRSGGNEFHGGAFGYYNDTGMRAYVVDEFATPDYSETGDAQSGNFVTSKDVRQEWGMDLGGYFWKDKIWFFGAYDRVQINQSRQTLDLRNLTTFGNEYPLSVVQNKYSGKITLNLLQGTSVVGTVFSDAQTQQGVLKTPTGNNLSSYAGRLDVGGPDYGARLTQLLGSVGIFTFQYARHEDRYATAPAGYGQLRVTDHTISGGGHTTALPPGSPFYPSGFGLVWGWQNNEGRRHYYGGAFTAYLANHEVKFGGDYQDDGTVGAAYFTGGGFLHVLPCLNATQHPGDASYCDLSKAPWWTNVDGHTRQVFFEHGYIAAGNEGDHHIAPASPFNVPTRRYGAFIQDEWRISPRLTANLGVRWDTESIYGEDPATGPFEAFSLTNQWSPRIGVVWDFVGDGTSKLYASAGRFYYALPTDSNVRDFTATSYVQTFNYSPTDATTQLPKCTVDVTAGCVPRAQLFIGNASGTPVDPGMKASYQDEYTLGVEKAFDPTLSVGLKGTYRSLGRTVEDRCDLDSSDPASGGSTCALFNPGGTGPAASGQILSCDGSGNPTDPNADECGFPGVAVQAAKRIFRGIELTARKAFTNAFWTQLSFLYSSLEGNYSGAIREASGQTDPGINADFDYYQFANNAYGNLELDRPVQVRIDAVYTAPFGLSAGLGFYVRSGIPVSRQGWFNSGYPQALFLDQRGTLAREPTDYDMNLSASYALNVGPVTVTPMLYLYNVINRQTVVNVNQNFNPTGSFVTNPASPFYGQAGIEPGTARPDGTICESATPCTDNPDYLKALPRNESGRTNPRLLRVALKITF
jgi:outer membrane receptor protein involved in Fe transport